MADINTKQREYLGDGLYAEYDGWQFRLYAHRDQTRRENGQDVHEVYLEPSALAAFIAFIDCRSG